MDSLCSLSISLNIDCLVGKDLFRFGAAEGSTRVCVFTLVLFRRHRKTSKSARSILRAAKVLYWLMNMGSNIAPELFLGLLRTELISCRAFVRKAFAGVVCFTNALGRRNTLAFVFKWKFYFDWMIPGEPDKSKHCLVLICAVWSKTVFGWHWADTFALCGAIRRELY